MLSYHCPLEFVITLFELHVRLACWMRCPEQTTYQYITNKYKRFYSLRS